MSYPHTCYAIKGPTSRPDGAPPAIRCHRCRKDDEYCECKPEPEREWTRTDEDLLDRALAAIIRMKENQQPTKP